jgi:hypothetical protein
LVRTTTYRQLARQYFEDGQAQQVQLGRPVIFAEEPVRIVIEIDTVDTGLVAIRMGMGNLPIPYDVGMIYRAWNNCYDWLAANLGIAAANFCRTDGDAFDTALPEIFNPEKTACQPIQLLLLG